jgi:uncharacterized phiE125 gp8 family phage protein
MIHLEAMRPGEVRWYEHDWSAFLGEDSIASQTTIGSGIAVNSSAVGDDADAVRFRVTAAAAGRATITQTIVTAGGQTEVETFTLLISVADEPVTINEAKAHLAVTFNDDDALINSLIPAARRQIEHYTGHILLQRQLTRSVDRFDQYLELHHRPIVSVDDIDYVDEHGEAQSYGDFVAQVDRFPARIHPALDGSWPSTWSHGGINVTYTAGYSAAEVPEDLKQAILMLVAHWYTNREAVNVGNIVNELPFGVMAICNAYRAPSL